MEIELFVQMAYALGIGLLVGLERSMGAQAEVAKFQAAGNVAKSEEPGEPPADAEEEAEGSSAASHEFEFLGVRTYGILGLVGFAAALLGERFELIAPVCLAVTAILVIALYHRTPELGAGITTEAAAIAVTALGMLCRYESHAAGVMGVILTILLASKRFTRRTVGQMRRVELTDTLKFLVAILIVLPLLPNEALDPYEVLNPYKVGLLVILISGISFVGYFLTRLLGAQKGLGITGVLGGLTSSTAVTAAMALEAKQDSRLNAICAFSTVAANATMFGRVLVVVWLLDAALVQRLVWPLGAMGLTAAAVAVFLWFSASKSGEKGARGDGKVKLKNPFSVGPALKFAAFFVVILFVAKFAKLFLGDSGIYLASLVSGLADVDAITLSISEQTSADMLSRDVGALGITIAVVANSVVKTTIAIQSGGWAFGRLVAIALGAATVVGLGVGVLL